MGLKIVDLDYHLPEKVVSNQDLIKEFKDLNVDKIEEKTGIRERHVVTEKETALDLAYAVSQKILKRHNKDLIDFIILCTQSPEYYLPTSACILQDRLGLKKTVGAFDFNLGCSGFIYGLAIAKGLIYAGVGKNILLVMSETYTKHIHCRDKGNRIVFGDAAAAVIIQQSDREDIMQFSLGTDGSGYSNLIVPNGGLRNRYNHQAEDMIDPSGNVRTANHLFMNGPEIFNFTIDAIPKLFSEILYKNNFKMEDVDYFIFHQANQYIIEYLRKKIKIPTEKFYENLKNTGNTVSASIPIALKDCLDKNIIKKGAKVLLLGFGVGYSWGGTIIRI